MPATSQLEWLISMTAMIVVFWSRATRDLLKSFGWGIAGTPRLNAATKLPFLAARPIASLGPARHYSSPSWSIPVRPTGALEPFHSQLGWRLASAYALLGSTILQGGCSHGQHHAAADQERDLD